jgi:hypothetical protein
MMLALLLVQLLATGFMTGLIWFVQVVHYPLFTLVGAGGFPQYEDRHTRRTTLVVAPAMVIEALAALALLVMVPAGVPSPLAWLGAVLIGAIWLSTLAVQAPCHRELSRGYAARAARRLSVTNWVRTLAWTARAGLAAAMLALHVR